VTGAEMDDLYTLSFRPRIERIEISDVDADAAPNVFDIEGSNGARALEVEFAWDRVDQEHGTESGWRASLTTELVGGPLGGDFDVWKNVVQATRVITLWRDSDDRAHTLRFRMGAGVATPLEGSGKVPIVERFFAGGSTGLGALRGFDYAGIGPRGEGDPSINPGAVRRSRLLNEGDPMGGEAVATGTIEYGIPLVADVMRGAVFVDAGTLSTNTGGLRRDYRVAAGFGIQIKVPFFGQIPLRFDFGFPIHKERGDERRVISFEFSSFF
jgi:outer membrane protein insertion porin family